MSKTATMVTCLLAMACTGFPADPRPNIVLIMADDLGYETIAANGGQSYATPRLDALAGTGIRFRHAYAQPVCTPTRVQLMTGKYNIRNYDVFGTLPAGQITFANLLRDAGYKTFISGKWQLNGDYDTPIAFGFDEYFLWQLNRKPNRYYAPGFEVYIPADGLNKVRVNYPPGTYGPDLVTEKILQFIERNQAGPFLVYYPMMLTHNPFTPTPDHPDYDPSSTTELTDPVYFGSMVEYMDKLVGRIVDKLDELGLRDDTLLLFTGDNGTGPRVTSMFDGQPVQGGKGQTTNVGRHVPFIANWPNTVPASQVTDALIDTSDVLPTLCEAAGVPLPQGIDGRSFLPQLLGQIGTPREWSYCWYKPPGGTEADVEECAHTTRFKLYQSGQFYDLANDLSEQSPLDTNSLSAEAQSAFALLTGVLASFGDERQDRSLAPRPDPAAWSLPPSANGPGSIAMTAASGVDANGPAEYQFKNVTLSRQSAWQFAPHYVDTGLSSETPYAYQVRMRDLLGNTTAWSDERSALALGSPAYANLLTNGGFEDPIGSEWTWTNVSGVTPTFYGVDAAAAHTGSYGYRIAYGDDVGHGYLQQTITGLTPGLEYQVSGWVKVYFRGEDRNHGYIEALGGGADVSSPAQGENWMVSNTVGIWTNVFVTQTADIGGNLTVRLHLDHWSGTSNNKDNGVYFDDIVVQVPEPATLGLGLLGGLGLLVVLQRRRRSA